MNQRAAQIAASQQATFDTLIIGGGINGAVSAAALAGRGASVALVDRGDFANFTSQESSNLVWGGFKYLENYEFGLVYDLCTSRNRLLKAYPTNISPIGFLATLDTSAPYAPWFAGAGALAYWAIGKFGTRRPHVFGVADLAEAEPAINATTARGAIEYHDAVLVESDARFAFSFVASAVRSGATALNYVEATAAERVDGLWHVSLCDHRTGDSFTVTAHTIVNAAGPFVDGPNNACGMDTAHQVVFSKGVHLVVPRLTTTSHDRVLAFFDDTQRLFYVIPMGERSVIGTTDTRVDRPETTVTAQDRAFLLDQINQRVRRDAPLTEHDIIAERCGVRALVIKRGTAGHESVDWTSLSRKHEIETDHDLNMVSIFGGKLTDCLNVGTEVANDVSALGVAVLDDHDGWFGEPDSTRERHFRQTVQEAGLDTQHTHTGTELLADRLWRRYGVCAHQVVETIGRDPAQAQPVLPGNDVVWAEVDHMVQNEMVCTLSDLLRRRTTIEMVTSRADMLRGDTLTELARRAFGEDADRELDRYLTMLNA